MCIRPSPFGGGVWGQKSLTIITINNYYVHQRLLVDLEKREAQLRDQEEELKQRDIEISRLVGELRQYQAQLQRLEQVGLKSYTYVYM